MKNLMVALVIVFAGLSAFAVNSVSVTVDGQSYACTPGGDTVDCQAKVAFMKNKMDLCSSGGYGAMTCIDKVWPNFKTANPSCVEEGAAICLDLCRSGGYGALQCLDKCQ